MKFPCLKIKIKTLLSQIKLYKLDDYSFHKLSVEFIGWLVRFFSSKTVFVFFFLQLCCLSVTLLNAVCEESNTIKLISHSLFKVKFFFAH